MLKIDEYGLLPWAGAIIHPTRAKPGATYELRAIARGMDDMLGLRKRYIAYRLGALPSSRITYHDHE